MSQIKPYVFWIVLFIVQNLFSETTAQPHHYICYTTPEAIHIDGKVDEKTWAKAAWSEYFVDIEGDAKPKPLFKTRFKMLKDSAFMYFAIELEEPHIWAKITEKDAVIFFDNDVEIFIDTDGDAHHYYEFEVNALNTYWDLLLTSPYRTGGKPVTSWDIKGLKVATHIYGTLNNATDTDSAWTIEVAMPWDSFIESMSHPKIPADNHIWRMNFSRVEWQTDIVNGSYTKRINPESGKPHPEWNWVWSPQGKIQMHQPETWGFIQFSDTIVGKTVEKQIDSDFELKTQLFKLFEAQLAFKLRHKKFATSLKKLKIKDIDTNTMYKPVLFAQINQFEIVAKSKKTNRVWHINHEGRVWKTDPE